MKRVLVFLFLCLLATSATYAQQIHIHISNEGPAKSQGMSDRDNGGRWIGLQGSKIVVVKNKETTTEIVDFRKLGTRGKRADTQGDIQITRAKLNAFPANVVIQNVDTAALYEVLLDFPNLRDNIILANTYPNLKAVITVTDEDGASQMVDVTPRGRGNRFQVALFFGLNKIDEAPSGNLTARPEGSALLLHIRDRNNEPVEGAKVTLRRSLDYRNNQTAVTGENGQFTASGLTDPFYRLTVEKDDHITETIRLNCPRSTPINFILKLSLDTGEIPIFFEEEVRARRLAFLVDTSGSMSGQKWQTTLRELQTAVSAMHFRTRFSVITFNSSVSSWPSESDGATILDASDDHKASFLRWVQRQSPSGMTDLYTGLSQAITALSSEFQGKPIAFPEQEIYLLSDGQPTQGITNNEEILRRIEALNENDTITIHTLEIGNDATSLLQKLSQQNGAGSYRKVMN